MFLFDMKIRYILLIILIIFNFLCSFKSPLIYSSSLKCLGIKCKNFQFIINLLSFTFLSSMMISMSILNKSLFIPTYWSIPIIILGYIFIYINWKNSKIVKIIKERLNPPPLSFLTKNKRIAVSFIFLFIYLLLFILNFLAHRIPIKGETFLDIVVFSSFGGFIEQRTACLTGWLSILGLATSIINIYYTMDFYPNRYQLPNSWRI